MEMLRKALFLTAAALLVTLATSSRAQAWGFYHYSYHYGDYGADRFAYRGYHFGGYPYGGYGDLTLGGYHYGGYHYGDFHYGYVRRW
jgi:hypothetical protein